LETHVEQYDVQISSTQHFGLRTKRHTLHGKEEDAVAHVSYHVCKRWPIRI